MPREYKMTSKFPAIATIDDKVLSISDNQSRRLILRSEIVRNGSNPDASVKITLRYQRKQSKDEWEDIPVDSLVTVRTNEEVQLIFDSQQTVELKKVMDDLYAVSDQVGVIDGITNLVVGRQDEVILTDENRARTIKALLEQNYAEELWKSLLETNPDLATRLSYARVQQDRQRVLEEFSKNSLATSMSIDLNDGGKHSSRKIRGYSAMA